MSERKHLLGAHTSTAGGLSTALDRAISIGATAIQIFVKNNMQWFARPCEKAEIAAFCQHRERNAIAAAFGHAGYMINLAAINPEFEQKSRRALGEELVRAHQLELPFLVLHPGAHLGAGVEAGLEKVVANLNAVFAAHPKVQTRVALEITAGQGTSLGHRFEHLAFLLAQTREPERLCVCLDTAHLFAAGYDLRTQSKTKQVFDEFARVIGWKHLAALHLNDSKTGFNSRVDRHAHIGQGEIGLEAFRFIMNHSRLAKIPKVLETPKGKEMAEDVENLALLRSLCQKRAK